jgi:ferric-dicitrate binding protein FerR (iron transport regulator)
MPEQRLWELLTKKFNKEITDEEIRELHGLLEALDEPMPSMEVLSDLELLRLKADLEDKARKKHSLAAILGAIRRPAAAPMPEGAPALGPAAPPQTAPPRRIGRRIAATAAAACLCAAAFYWVYRPHRDAAEAFNTIVTKPGSKTLITLPDGSTVVLNSACKFGYSKGFGVSNRTMTLSGEAYFDIRKNPDLPLSISAGNVNIKVLGTSFNVKAYPQDSFVEACLITGSIQVSLKTDPERAILLRPHEKIVIRNNEGAAQNKDAENKSADNKNEASKNPQEVITVSKVEPEPGDSVYVETAWLNDKMIFHKEAFPSLAKRMERWFNVKIVLRDPALNDMFFTGSFEQENLRQALEALHNSARFTYVIKGQTVIVSKE